jgi:hypothetical protein
MRTILFCGLVALGCVATLNCSNSSATAPGSLPATGAGGSSSGGGGDGGSSGGGGLGTAVFSDGDFDDNGWEVVVQLLGPGGSGGAGHLQSGGVGNSDYRRTIITVNSAEGSGIAAQVAVFSIKRDAVYFPSDGAISSIDYAEDSILLAGGGNGQTSAPALRQNGMLYTLVSSTGAFLTPELAWTPHVVNGRTPDHFRTLQSASEHPNFSATGGRIEFGFMRLHSVPSGSAGGTRTGGIDNWRVTLNR